jgi:excisionase family DNA binding protein
MKLDSDIFDIREAAAFLGAHEQTVRRLARRNAIPCFKVGRNWRFRKEALECWTGEHHRDVSEAQDRGTRACSVLVVVAEEKICRAMSGKLYIFGCNVRHATCGEEGLALVRQEKPDLILLDLMMSGMNGPQFLAELRRTHPELLVVIVTGYPDGELMQQAIQYAPLMILATPVEQELLERTVRVVLAKRAAV